MINRNHRLALTKQSALLGIIRGGVYYEPAPVSDADLALMRRLDELRIFLKTGATRQTEQMRLRTGLISPTGSTM
jgi:putative transposase